MTEAATPDSARFPLLTRYRAGQRRRVWSHLLALGERVRQEPFFSDAWAVACETMRRARVNVERLVRRLRALGYAFDDPEKALTPPGPNTAAQVAEVERRLGPLPLSLRAWYEVVGGVNLMGPDTGAWSDYAGADPLVVYSLEVALVASEWGTVGMMLGPDSYHKAGMSGGGPYHVAVPNTAADGLVLGRRGERGRGERVATFVNYLRICFRWGGFPYKVYVANPRPRYGMNPFTGESREFRYDHPPGLRHLARGLLPI